MLKLKINDLFPPHICAKALHTQTQIYIENKPQSTNLPQLPMLQRFGVRLCGLTKWRNRKTRESQKPSNQQVRMSKSNLID